MAYIKANYPEFGDIKIMHFDGYNPVVTLGDVLAFLADPANTGFRLIDTHVNYFFPLSPIPSAPDPEASIWVEVTIIYTE